MFRLSEPHGGALVNRFVAEDEAPELEGEPRAYRRSPSMRGSSRTSSSSRRARRARSPGSWAFATTRASSAACGSRTARPGRCHSRWRSRSRSLHRPCGWSSRASR